MNEATTNLMIKRRKKHRSRYNGDVKIPPSLENGDTQNMDTADEIDVDDVTENDFDDEKIIDIETTEENDIENNTTKNENHIDNKTPQKVPISLDLDPSNSFTTSVKSPHPNEDSSSDRLSPIFLESGKILQNPSPGRSRRSGILFKKKQYQPVKPSPLVIYSSTESDNQKSPLKLHLRLHDKSDSIKNNIGSENNDPNIPPSYEVYQKIKSPDKIENSRNYKDIVSPTPNGYSHCNSNIELDEYDEYDSEYSSPQKCNRKRTYTSSSDSDGTTQSNPKRKCHKRGRQKSAPKSFQDEFGNLDGLNDIKYGIYMITSEEIHLLDPKCHPEKFDFITLIWAKCKGYPSYPAMTIDPNMPRTGFQSNGVPIPIPPIEVLQMNEDEDKYLILFFDARRTWQWLPREKIEPLGIDSRLDEHKLNESKKPSKRKNVQEAYKRAIAFRRRLELGENSDGEIRTMNGDSNMNSENESDIEEGTTETTEQNTMKDDYIDHPASPDGPKVMPITLKLNSS